MTQTDRSFSGANRPMPATKPFLPEASSSAEELRRRSRRNLFRAGLSVVPFVLTLRNRAAWGQTGDNGTTVTPISEAKRKGLSEEEIEQLRRQLQQAEQLPGSGWLQEGGGDF
jgi:hypothetical protein